jgi:hypothetical protein
LTWKKEEGLGKGKKGLLYCIGQNKALYVYVDGICNWHWPFVLKVYRYMKRE